MANTNATGRRQLSRLQKRAPSSIQIAPVEWNVAIPLLSPLVQSPTSNEMISSEIRSNSSSNKEDKKASTAAVMKKWQHPAAPFCYEQTALFRPPFVSAGTFNR